MRKIDTHTHLIPAVDDGCKNVAQSIDCARKLIEAGYTDAFCTPHVWPSLRGNTVDAARAGVSALQTEFDRHQIALRLHPGGEIGLLAMWPTIQSWPREQIVTYSLAGKFVLFDFWAERVGDFATKLENAVAHLISLDLVPILAHPERIGALQREPAYVDRLLSLGVRLQINTWCLAEPRDTPLYQTAANLLRADKYFILGTDTHHPAGMDKRIAGLAVAQDLVGDDRVRALTEINPRELLAEDRR